jgi:hypothetical protein
VKNFRLRFLVAFWLVACGAIGNKSNDAAGGGSNSSKGEPGDRGEKGDTGEKGEKSAPGLDGAAGNVLSVYDANGNRLGLFLGFDNGHVLALVSDGTVLPIDEYNADVYSLGSYDRKQGVD